MNTAKKSAEIDVFAPVSLEPMTLPGGGIASKQAVMIRDEEGVLRECGIVGANYNLIENERVVESALEILRETGLTFEERRTLWDGKRFARRWVINGMDFTVDTEKGDLIRPTFDVYNSYDGSMAVGAAFNAERVACLNGMTIDFLLGGFQFRHLGNNGEGKRELRDATERLMNLAPMLSDAKNRIVPLLEQKANVDDVRKYFEKTGLPASIAYKVLMATPGKPDLTAWELYNATTATLTEIGTFASEQWNRTCSSYFLAGIGRKLAQSDPANN